MSDPIVEPVDRNRLLELRARFLALNSLKLQRVKEGLTLTQQQFLRLLPVLLQVNHPSFPGFVDKSTPVGLVGFNWDKDIIAAARSLSRGFTPQRFLREEAKILSLFLMGSLGTIAQTPRSDFDIWLCYQPKLSATELAKLEQKAQLISQWAQTLGLEVHFFLMNHQAFLQGDLLPMSEESSGELQRILLLDEFYRTSIWLAGRLPVWWLVPAAVERRGEYARYIAVLLRNHFISDQDYIDFGASAHFTAEEFVGAGLWQLHKAIEAPYKSVLKLVLLEAYVNYQAEFSPLSLLHKQKIHAGRDDLNELDPYIALYQFLEDYLLRRSDSVRLEVVRRSFYFKVNRGISKKIGMGAKSWQRQVLERMCRHWGWSSARIAYLDERMRWSLKDVMAENDALVATLMRSFLELNVAARHSGLNNKLCGDDFRLLSHKLTAAFGVKPGKQLLINPGIKKDLTTQQLWLKKPTPQTWALADSNGGNDLYTANSVQELLLWCSVNSIISAHSKLIWPAKPDAGTDRARTLMHNWVVQNNTPIALAAFKQEPRVEALLVIINWHTAPADFNPAASGGAFDVLNYGPNQLNLIQRLDCFTRNSWGEWACVSFSGQEALVDYLRWCWRELTDTCWQWMQCETVASHLSTACSQRVQQLMRALFNCFNRSDMRQRRFLFSFGGKHCCLQWQNDDLLPLTIYSERDLWNFLAVEQEVFCPLVVDTYCLPQQPLAVIGHHVQPGVSQLFYCVAAQTIVLYICDDKGAILRLQLETQEKQQQLVHWIGFLRRALALWQDQHPHNLADINSLALFEIIPQQQGFAVQRKAVHLEIPAPVLAATIAGGWSDDAQITLSCAGESATWPYLASSGPLNRNLAKTKSADPSGEESAWDHMARWLTPLLPAGQGIIRLDELGWPGATKDWQLVSLVKCKLMVETQLNIARIRQRKREGS
ncbi:MAG TPA: class I adenylate cyclase [Marinagarivorans sp.]|nr:class I adenylate cyclase [Marinagarivorans sp.]